MERARFLYSNGYRGREGCIICFLGGGRISPGGACGGEREHVSNLEKNGGRERGSSVTMAAEGRRGVVMPHLLGLT